MFSIKRRQSLDGHYRFDLPPQLYNSASELIWPDVIKRIKTHPDEIQWVNPTNGLTVLHFICRYPNTEDVISTLLSHEEEKTKGEGRDGPCDYNSSKLATKMTRTSPVVTTNYIGNNKRKRITTIQDNSGSTPLHIACSRHCNESTATIVKLLLANPAAAAEAVLIKDNKGRTPLHVACNSLPPSIETLKVLLDADKSVKKESLFIRDNEGNTPMSLLCRRNETRIQIALNFIDEYERSGYRIAKKYLFTCVLKPFWKQLCLLVDEYVHSHMSNKTTSSGDQRDDIDTLNNDSNRDDFGVSSKTRWKLLHALSVVPSCPTLLFALILKLYPEQIEETNDFTGSCPLHCALQYSTCTCHTNIGVENNYASRTSISRISNSSDHIYCQNHCNICSLINAYPNAVQTYEGNCEGRLPLHIAIEAATCGSSSNSTHKNVRSCLNVIKKLFVLYPTAISLRNYKNYLYPFMIAALAADDSVPPEGTCRACNNSNYNDKNNYEWQTKQVTLIYELLSIDPSLLCLSQQPTINDVYSICV